MTNVIWEPILLKYLVKMIEFEKEVNFYIIRLITLDKVYSHRNHTILLNYFHILIQIKKIILV